MCSVEKMFTCVLYGDCYNITVLQFLKSKKHGFIAYLPLENHKNLFVEHQKSFLKTVICNTVMA